MKMQETEAEFIARARMFAIQAYEGLCRRNRARTPLWMHAEEVAALVAQAGGSAAEIAAAWLHDVVEDTPYTIDDIRRMFGDEVAELVDGLTDPEEFAGMPTKERKLRQAERVVAKPHGVKRVKIADQISNVSSLIVDAPFDWPSSKSLAYAEGAAAIVSACAEASVSLAEEFTRIYVECVRVHTH
jgi:(p)ppGpp synthase/HD superfamily hydrolase